MTTQADRFYEFGPFRIDRVRYRLMRGDEVVPLTPKAFDTLLALVENAGEVIEKDRLMKIVWPHTFIEEGNLTYNISTLRKALGEKAGDHQYIRTVPGRGYCFVASVKEVMSNGSPDADEPAPLDVNGEETDGNIHVELIESYASGERDAMPARRLNLRMIAILLLVVSVSAVAYVRIFKPFNKLAARPAIKSIAVLPFKPLVAESRSETLELGMADALITKLSRASQLVVRPISAVRKYTGMQQDPLAAGREQGVELVLEGSIQTTDDRIRVTARLLSVNDGTAIWAETFEETFTHIFSVQDSISEKVTGSLALSLSGEEKRLLARRYTENAEAYQLYIKGRFFWNMRTEDGLRKAITYFNQAIEKDPSYALAYAGIADSYAVLGDYFILSPDEAFPKAKQAAEKALQLDGQLAEAHASLSYIKHYYDWDWEGAEREFKRAIELNRHYPSAHQWYAEYLVNMSRFDEAMKEIERARLLDPLSLPINMVKGWLLYLSRRYDEAIDQSRNTLEMDTGAAFAHNVIGSAYVQKGMYQEALIEFQAAKSIAPGEVFYDVRLAYGYALSGRREEAQRLLGELIERSKREYVSPGDIAAVYAGLGEKDKAFEWLEKGYRERFVGMAYLEVDPTWDGIRSDSRFADLLRRVRLAE